jgi:hypothetical protein
VSEVEPVHRPTPEPREALLEISDVWAAVARIVEVALHDGTDLSAQGLGPLAADVLERRGRPIPSRLLRQQHRARVAMLAAPDLLARVREACEGPILVFKGPEIALLYPEQARAFVDVDVLVPDAAAAQSALLGAGFVEDSGPEETWVQHLTPLRWPGGPLKVEVHSEPHWPDGLTPPPNDELFASAVPSSTGVAGVLAPAPAHHALLVAAHAWAHKPLGKARDLVDVGALRVEADPAELRRLARTWDIAPVWQATSAALDALLAGRKTWPLRLWAGHVSAPRPQTVLEQHLERLLSPFWAFPPRRALGAATSALLDEFRPAADETRRDKLRRSAAALRRPFTPVKEHDSMLGESATRHRRRR